MNANVLHRNGRMKSKERNDEFDRGKASGVKKMRGGKSVPEDDGDEDRNAPRDDHQPAAIISSLWSHPQTEPQKMERTIATV